MSVYNQQQQFFDKHLQPDICPRQQWIDDLLEEVSQWMEQGDQIVIFADMNEDTRSSNWNQQLLDTGLRNILTHRHGTRCPSTCLRNNSGIPIDAIYVTPGLLNNPCGMFAPSDMPFGDHRMMWIDLPIALVFSYDPNPAVISRARRLKLQIGRASCRERVCQYV